MAYDKKTFLKKVIILHDTREQKNGHILAGLDSLKVKHQPAALRFGDYSFIVENDDFSLSCVIERKADVDELYGNLTKDRERIEKEFSAAYMLAKEFSLLIENCDSLETLNEYKVPDWQMKKFDRKIQNIGKYCYSTIQSWQAGNRYQFKTIFVEDKNDTAAKILECFYWYWRNFKKALAGRRNRN